MFDWDYFDRFEWILDKYLPFYGEGENMASQAVTAVNKLIYKAWNDGDVYDNTYKVEGWANDLSSYANWLYNNLPETISILNRIENCEDMDDYGELLADLADLVLNEPYLKEYENLSVSGSIYNADGPFKFVNWDYED